MSKYLCIPFGFRQRRQEFLDVGPVQRESVPDYDALGVAQIQGARREEFENDQILRGAGADLESGGNHEGGGACDQEFFKGERGQ